MVKSEGHSVRKAGFSVFKKDFYLVTAPWWMRLQYPGCVWDKPAAEKTIYLTFDDGPHPLITRFVLNELKKYEAKATFFCIGDNVRKFPETYQELIAEGHAVGNHTMHHINGWNNSDDVYLNDIAEAKEYITATLFRPPYGRIKRSQVRALREKGIHPVTSDQSFQIIMWSVLAGDWDITVSPEKCFERVKQKIYPGCIVVLHDSEKAGERMRFTLPRILEYGSSQGYRFSAL